MIASDRNNQALRSAEAANLVGEVSSRPLSAAQLKNGLRSVLVTHGRTKAQTGKQAGTLTGAIRPTASTKARTAAVTPERLQRWQETVTKAEVMAVQLSSTDPITGVYDARLAEDYKGVMAHFVVNMDETCENPSLHSQRVYGDASKRKHEVHSQDVRLSISILLGGSAAGASCPIVFLLHGPETMPLQSLSAHAGLPRGSMAVYNPSAYMTGSTFAAFAEPFCVALRDMPVVRMYPHFWMIAYMDQFGGHMEPEVLQIFRQHKILMVFEESQSSHACQVFDGEPAMVCKKAVASLLPEARAMADHTSQEWFFGVCVTALSSCKADFERAFKAEFKRRNLCPGERLSAPEWIQRSERLRQMVIASLSLQSEKEAYTPLYVQSEQQIAASAPSWYTDIRDMVQKVTVLSGCARDSVSCFLCSVQAALDALADWFINQPPDAADTAALEQRLADLRLARGQLAELVKYKITVFVNRDWIAAARAKAAAGGSDSSLSQQLRGSRFGDLASFVANPPSLWGASPHVRFNHLTTHYARFHWPSAAPRVSTSDTGVIGALGLEVSQAQVHCDVIACPFAGTICFCSSCA